MPCGPYEERFVTKEQERARARRRHEEQQKTAKPPVSDSTRDKQVFGVILAVILVIAAVIAVPKLVGSSDTPAAAEATPSATTPGATSTPASTGGLLAGQKLAAGCTAPPANQTNPKQQTTVPSKATAAGKTFVATVKTTCGVITMELDGTKAPQTVASFLNLAKTGYWAPSPCHRLTTEGIYVLQCGDPTGSGEGGPGYSFADENLTGATYPAGTVAMANSGANTNGSQFFLVYKDTQLPPSYTPFGKITGGLDV